MKPKSEFTVSSPTADPKKRFLRNTKRRGEIAELAFLHKAASMGFAVTKPYGDSESYDFVVDSGDRFWRVQVKSSSSMNRNGYTVSAHHLRCEQSSKQAYTPKQIDILAAYIVPADAWYIIPVRTFAPATCLHFGPHLPGRSGKFERFREAWLVMACRRNGEPRDGIVTSPACSYSPSSGSSCPSCPFRKK